MSEEKYELRKPLAGDKTCKPKAGIIFLLKIYLYYITISLVAKVSLPPKPVP